MTAIGAEYLWLRSASGREGLVAWDSYATGRAGAYGDALTIDTTQGLTSTEHIEAMPADTRAVDAFKADTSGSRRGDCDLVTHLLRPSKVQADRCACFVQSVESRF